MFAKRTAWKLTANRLSNKVQELRRRGEHIRDLSESNPTRCGFVYNSKEILRALADPRGLEYQPEPKGLLRARQAVEDYYRERRGAPLAVSPESILLTTSTSEGYSFVFRLLCEPGDEVLAPAPSYPLFEYLAGLQDVKLVPYSLLYDHGWHIDFHSLEQAVTRRTRAVVVVHPNNPTGSYVKSEELAKLNKIYEGRGLAIIADEVFLDYAHGGDTPSSFAANAPALTFTLSGVSKVSALPQMKASWVVTSGPPELVGEALARLEVIADTYLSLSTPVQLALPTLLGQEETMQAQIQARIRSNLHELDRQLTGQRVCTRLEVEGGWYAVLRVPATRSDEDLAVELLETHLVLVHPGHFYDFPKDGFLVVSLITREDTFREGVAAFLESFE